MSPRSSTVPALGQMGCEKPTVVGIPLDADSSTTAEIGVRRRRDRLVVRIEVVVGH